jgi:hypothetical protein
MAVLWPTGRMCLSFNSGASLVLLVFINNSLVSIHHTGAAFTRFQTLRLQKVFPGVLSDQLISYGSCQFPTLGFVVDRVYIH